MTDNTLTIPYPEELLLSLKKSPDEFEAEARLLLAVKLYELHQVSSGVAAQLAGLSRAAFLLELARFGLSPLGQEPDELAEDYNNA
jgi:predicted HTH domain antitoxin